MIHYECHSSFQDSLIGVVRKLIPFKPQTTGISSLIIDQLVLSWENCKTPGTSVLREFNTE